MATSIDNGRLSEPRRSFVAPSLTDFPQDNLIGLWLNGNYGAASILDETSNNLDFTVIGGPRLNTAAGTLHMQRSDAVRTISTPLARLDGALTAYVAVMVVGTGTFYLACYDTDPNIDPLWGIGVTAESLAAWVGARSTTNRLIYSDRGTVCYLQKYMIGVACLAKGSDQSIDVYWQGARVGRLLGTSTGTPTVAGTEVLALGGTASSAFGLPAALYGDVKHDQPTIAAISRTMLKGLLYDFG